MGPESIVSLYVLIASIAAVLYGWHAIKRTG